MKLQLKLLLILVPLTAIPIGIFGWLAYSQQRDRLDREAEIESTSAIISARDLMTRRIESVESDIKLFVEAGSTKQYAAVNSPQVRKLFHQSYTLKIFRRYQKLYPEYVEIRVLWQSGLEEVRSTIGDISNVTNDELDSPYFANILSAGDGTFSQLVLSPDTGEPVLIVSKAIDSSGLHNGMYRNAPQQKAFLVVTVSLDELQRQISDIKLTDKNFLLVTNGQSAVMLSPDGYSSIDNLPIMDQGSYLSPNGDELTNITYKGSPHTLRGMRVSDDLQIFSVFEESEFHDSIRYMATLAFLIVFFTVIITSFLLTVVLDALVIKPLGLLSAAAVAIGNGEAFNLDFRSRDEISQLARSFQDMGERLRESHLRYEHLAHHDSLTDLPNRRLFLELLKSSISQAERQNKFVGVMFLDLDDFKRINDTLGHAAGDSLLRKVGERIQGVVRTGEFVDNIVARVGGDEFIVLLNGLEECTAPSLVANRILASLEEPIEVGEELILAKTSIGIAVYPNDGTTSTQLMRNADTAMYHAKDTGKNNFHFFTDDLNERIFKRIAMEQKLQWALEREELVLHYQPQVDTDTGIIVGVESLVRWNEPGNGLVPPGEFIPIAEESGLIVPLGEWVLQEACRQAKAWQEMGFDPMSVSVNVSARQFRDVDMVLSVDRALKNSGLDPQYLDIELTETAIVEDPEKIGKTLSSLKALGVYVSMDDFGTGYSSLGMLRRLPIDCLKIDQSFVRDIATSPNDAAITSAIIAMGKSLDMNVIAEGVEDEQQLDFLRKHRCERVQGYYASRPVEADEITRLLEIGEPLIEVKKRLLKIAYKN